VQKALSVCESGIRIHGEMQAVVSTNDTPAMEAATIHHTKRTFETHEKHVTHTNV
jgi:hypothetical protein